LYGSFGFEFFRVKGCRLRKRIREAGGRGIVGKPPPVGSAKSGRDAAGEAEFSERARLGRSNIQTFANERWHSSS